jgi:hypothetical protein
MPGHLQIPNPYPAGNVPREATRIRAGVAALKRAKAAEHDQARAPPLPTQLAADLDGVDQSFSRHTVQGNVNYGPVNNY